MHDNTSDAYPTRRRRLLPLTATGLVAGAFLAVAATASASAHVTVTPGSAAADSYSVLTFSVGHGCEGSPTTALTIDIPEPILSVTPTINPNWDVAKVMEPVADAPADGHGEAVEERTAQVVYTAKTPLADGYRDTVALQVRIPAEAAGETLEFPVLQSCEVGETDWAESTVGGEEPELPAPFVTVSEAGEGGDGHGHGGATAEETAEAGATDDGSTDAAVSAPAEGATDDVVARVIGIVGLVVGAVGVTLAVLARRRPEKR